MVNPLARVQVTSKEPPKRPEAIPPEPEHYAGTNQPYRGINDHGVKATEKPSPTQADWDTREGHTYMAPEEEYEPIPVRIVQQHGNEFRQFRVHRMSVNAAKSVQLLGRNHERSSVYLTNPDAALDLFISHRPEMPLGGFILHAGQNITLYTHDEIYVMGAAVDPAVQTAQALEYYSIEA
jgi:hypothetical protein